MPAGGAGAGPTKATRPHQSARTSGNKFTAQLSDQCATYQCSLRVE
jgi:hypothetical protein